MIKLNSFRASLSRSVFRMVGRDFVPDNTLRLPLNSTFTKPHQKIAFAVIKGIDSFTRRVEGYKPIKIGYTNPKTGQVGTLKNWRRKTIDPQRGYVSVETLRWDGSEFATTYKSSVETPENVMAKYYGKNNDGDRVTAIYDGGGVVMKKSYIIQPMHSDVYYHVKTADGGLEKKPSDNRLEKEWNEKWRINRLRIESSKRRQMMNDLSERLKLQYKE